VERSFPTPGETRLRIRNPAGHVAIETAETDETTVRLEALRNDEVTRTAIENATVEQTGPTVTVEIAGKSWAFLGRSPSVGVTIRCPYGTALDCTTASGDVSATGRLGQVDVKTASGDVQLEHVGGFLDAKTASGDVRVTEADGPANLNLVSGDARVDLARSGLEVRLVSGDLEVGEAHADLSVNSVSGDQQIRSVRAGEIHLRSVSGDLHVGVAPGTRVFIDASSTSGDVGSALDVTQAPGETRAEGGGEAKLRLKSVSGDISIVRGQLPAEVA
jgi:DUF4097 and DUF4098 domain-containing protein YvlB